MKDNYLQMNKTVNLLKIHTVRRFLYVPLNIRYSTMKLTKSNAAGHVVESYLKKKKSWL